MKDILNVVLSFIVIIMCLTLTVSAIDDLITRKEIRRLTAENTEVTRELIYLLDQRKRTK